MPSPTPIPPPFTAWQDRSAVIIYAISWACKRDVIKNFLRDTALFDISGASCGYARKFQVSGYTAVSYISHWQR